MRPRFVPGPSVRAFVGVAIRADTKEKSTMLKALTESAVEHYRRDGYCKPFSLLEPEEAAETDEELAANGFSFRLRRDRLRRVRRREGRYLLRSNMVAEDPATLWC